MKWSLCILFAVKANVFFGSFFCIQPQLVDCRSNGWHLSPSTSDASPQRAMSGCLVRNIWMQVDDSSCRTKGVSMQVCACGRSSQWLSSHSSGWRTARWSSSWSQGSDCPYLSSAPPQRTPWCPVAGPTSRRPDPSSPTSLVLSGTSQGPLSVATATGAFWNKPMVTGAFVSKWNSQDGVRTETRGEGGQATPQLHSVRPRTST